MPLPIFFKKKCHIAIAAGKGGVGKSTVVNYLSRAFAKLGKRVGVFDADIYGPSLRHMLKEESLPRWEGERLLPAKSGAISLISPSFFEGAEMGFSVRGPVAHKLIQHLCRHTDFSECDYIFYDFPPGTGDVQMTLCEEVDFLGALLVTTPQEVAQIDVRKAYFLFEKMGVPVLGLIENMGYFVEPVTKVCHFPFGQGGGEMLAHQLGVPFMGTLPLEREVSLAADEGRELSRGEALLAFDRIAESYLTMGSFI